MAACLVAAAASDKDQLIDALKNAEQSAGFKPTGNFAHADARVPAYYRCYYTGKLELPETYSGLDLRQGTKDGCSLDETKYDVFFYPIEAVASGHAPVTRTLASAPAERVATVVPHEDFHAQIETLPEPIAEAAATLIGFAVADEVVKSKQSEVDLFLAKAKLINRYYGQLRETYRTARNKRARQRALQTKATLFSALEHECRAIAGEPRSFNKCVSAPNNAGLAFDYTYTRYYPLLHRVFSACARDTKCAVGVIVKAPEKRPETEVAAYFENFISSAASRKPPD